MTGLWDDGDDEDGVLIETAGPISVSHLLLHLSARNRAKPFRHIEDADCGDHARDALEVWQTAPRPDGSRWRWYVKAKGVVVQEAPGDVHHLDAAAVLTVTVCTLPGRDAVVRLREALKASGASCVRKAQPRVREAAAA